MPVYKDGKSGWRVVYRYTDFRGELKQTQKRGFKTQREAKQWEHEQILKTEASLDMTFGSFVEIFAIDKQERIKESTWANKEHIIRTKIRQDYYIRNRAELQDTGRNFFADADGDFANARSDLSRNDFHEGTVRAHLSAQAAAH